MQCMLKAACYIVHWNLSNPVTFGPKIIGLIKEVAAIVITSLEQSLSKICQIVWSTPPVKELLMAVSPAISASRCQN